MIVLWLILAAVVVLAAVVLVRTARFTPGLGWGRRAAVSAG